MRYREYSQIFKALSDAIRLEIVMMLRQGTLCACEILERFKITQPTLSYHMKILTDSGIVKCTKKGKWNHYSVNLKQLNLSIDFLRGKEVL